MGAAHRITQKPAVAPGGAQSAPKAQPGTQATSRPAAHRRWSTNRRRAACMRKAAWMRVAASCRRRAATALRAVWPRQTACKKKGVDGGLAPAVVKRKALAGACGGLADGAGCKPGPPALRC